MCVVESGLSRARFHKIARESQQEKYEKWKNRIDLALKAQEPLLKRAEKHYKAYNNETTGKKKSAQSSDVEVNLIYVDLKQSISALYSKNPKIYFTPENPGSEKAAEIIEIVVENRWNKLKMKSVMRDAIKSTKFDGMCGFKTYFNFSEDFQKDIFNDTVFNDEVRTERVPLKYLLKDPSADSWHTSTWIAHIIEAPILTIASKFGIKKSEITVNKSTTNSKDLKSDDQEDFQYGTYYEIEDRVNGEIFYLVEGYEGYAQKPEKKKYPYDTMYDFLFYNDIPGESDPLPDYDFWRDQYLEINRLRTMINRHAKKGVAKYKWMGVPPTDLQLAQARSSAESSVIELSAGQQIETLTHANLDPTIFQALNLASSDIQLISKNAPRQIAGQDKTATEVKAIEAASQEVSSENLERLEEVCQSIAYKWAKLMQENYDSTRIISLTGMDEAGFIARKNSLGDLVSGDSKRAYLSFTKENISGDVQCSVKSGSTAPDNEQARIAKLSGFVKFASSFPGLSAGIDVQELLDEAIEVFGLRNQNLTIRKDNPTGESKLLNSGVFLPARMSENHDAHIEIHERESNGNNQNILHILMHKEFKRQLEENASAQQIPAALGMPQAPSTGQSFLGGSPNVPPPSQGPLGPTLNPTIPMSPGSGGLPPMPNGPGIQ